MPNSPLPPDRLRHGCDPSSLPFETTADLEPLDGPFEQSRAAEALAFGASMRSEGYHVYALGPPGVGKHRLVSQVLAAQAARAPVPSDWCYVHNFEDPQRPRHLELPAGTAVQLKADTALVARSLPAGYVKQGENSFVSPNYDSAENRVILDVGLAIGTVTIKQQ